MTMPEYGSEEWHDYVMSKFHESEMYNGNFDCRFKKAAEQLLGDILVSRPTTIIASDDPNGPPRYCSL